jgi:hypothetical protein
MAILHNPIPIRGRIEQCWLLAFRCAPDSIRPLLPPELAPIEWDGWAYWSLVVCRLSGMRPAFLPAPLGIGYHHVAYRIYAQCHPAGASEPQHGLFFVRSDCDHALIRVGGNLVTDFHFHRADIIIRDTEPEVTLEVTAPGASGRAVLRRDLPPLLPPGSPFPDPEVAADALKYHPCGLAPGGAGRVAALRIGRDEAAWRHRVLHVREAAWEFFGRHPAQLELCCEVDPIDYLWHPVRTLRVDPYRQ